MNAKQLTMGEVTPEYQAFVEKFKPKLTTDDCYTPENVYEAVKGWVFRRYALPPETPVVRPFWPGGDYQAEAYPEGCVVIDNPPFSIMTEIEQFYLNAGIPFFLFAPGLSLFKSDKRMHYVLCGETITYANGAKVNSSFVTNMGEYLIESAPDLCQAIRAANRINEKAEKKELPKYTYPLEVATAARFNWYAQHGTVCRVKPEDACFVRRLDCQGEKTIFGAGFLLGRRAAAERAAAERAAAERAAAWVWELSPREREIVEGLG